MDQVKFHSLPKNLWGLLEIFTGRKPTVSGRFFDWTQHTESTSHLVKENG